jgi:hypothetical protein
MGKLKQNQSGFSAVETGLILVIVGIIGFTGWFVLHSRQDADKTFAGNTTSAPTLAKTKAATKSTNAMALNEASASQFALNFYKKYAPLLDDSEKRALITQDGTANLLDYFTTYQHGFDSIVCAQERPEHITVSKATINDSIVTVWIDESFSDVGLIQVKVIDSGGLKIDLVTCPGSLGNLPPGDGEGN